jgi:hypothetical protein
MAKLIGIVESWNCGIMGNIYSSITTQSSNIPVFHFSMNRIRGRAES